MYRYRPNRLTTRFSRWLRQRTATQRSTNHARR